MEGIPSGLLNKLERVLERALESGEDEMISDFIVEQSPDEKTRSRLVIAALMELRSGHADVGRNVVRRLDVEYNKLPDGFCCEIIKEFNRDRSWDFALIRQAADITAQRLLKPNDTLLSATWEWLLARDLCETLLESIAKKNGRRVMENLMEKDPQIVCYLLHRRGEPKTITLHLLEKVAKHDERTVEISETMSDIFEDCVHSEGWTEIANQVFKIASILNPVHEPKEVVRVDTAYLMNWCKQKNLFSNLVPMNIQNLIGELGRPIMSSPDLQCFHEILRLNRIVDLLMLLDQGIKRYRGHDIHQFNVAALGLFFLDTHIKDGRSLEDYLSEFYGEQFDEPLDIRKTWLLSSLLHDHALPIYHMFAITPHIFQRIRGGTRRAGKGRATRDSYLNALRRFRTALELAYYDLLSDNLSRVYNAFKTDAENKEEVLKNLVSKEMSRIGLSKFAKNRINHGVIGAANITSRFEGSLDTNVEVLARAIGMHDMKEEPISFRKDPITFLLVACDELQEWGREVALFPEILMDIPSIKIGGFRIEDGKRFFTDSLNVSFRFLKGTKRVTRFDPTYFIEAKERFLENRLKFDAPDVFPKISFQPTATVSNLSCKGGAEAHPREWAWSS